MRRTAAALAAAIGMGWLATAHAESSDSEGRTVRARLDFSIVIPKTLKVDARGGATNAGVVHAQGAEPRLLSRNHSRLILKRGASPATFAVP